MFRITFFKSILTSLLLSFSILSAIGQKYTESDFVKTNPPLYSTDEWYVLNTSTNDFSVFNKSGVLIIKKHTGDTNTQLKLPNGRLIGTDMGERGGVLKFIPTGKPKDAITIKQGNIKLVFHFRDSLYFIEGLAHLSTNTGVLYRLDTVNKTYAYTGVIGFEDAPEAFAIYDSTLFIASHQSFYLVHNNLKKEVVLRNVFWRSLYPNSIAIMDYKHVYIGIRGGYVKLNLKTKQLTFYKYKTQDN